MSVGAGSIKRAARTAGKKENKTALPKAEENGSVKAEPEAGSETAAQAEGMSQEAASVTKTAPGRSRTRMTPKSAESETEAADRTEKADSGKAADKCSDQKGKDTGSCKTYRIGQQLPTHLL